MSDNSNIGYGSTFPNSNVNNLYANTTAQNNPSGFGSNQGAVAGHGIQGAVSNVAAANGCLSGFCNVNHEIKGGRKYKNSKKIYKSKHKIVKMKKHNSRKSKLSRGISKIRRAIGVFSNNLFKTRKHKKHGKHVKHGKRKMHSKKRYHHKGGYYQQYQSNIPNTPIYSLANTNLSAGQSALASPPPYQTLSNCQNCTDNYNHYTNKGFQV
jgi:hypothetical protein